MTRQKTPKKANAPAELPKPGMGAFATREKANEGHTLPLYTATGELTAHWLRVRGIDSDTFRAEKNKQTRRLSEIVELPEEERFAAVVDATLEMRAALVAGWSFDEPFNPEKVKEFLREAPQIADKIDEFASRRAFFFKMPPSDLTPMPNSSLG